MIIIFTFVFLSFVQASPVKCPPDSYVVRAHHRQAYYKSDGTFVRDSNVQTHCRQKSKTYEFWIGKLKDGFPPGWPHKTEAPSKWTEEEKARVLEALDELPEE